MTPRLKRPRPLFLVFIGLAALYLIADLGRHPLDDVDGLYTAVARGMWESRDFVTPYVDGVRFLDKPPLMYWVMAASYEVLGFSDWAGRLPFALATVGAALLLGRAGEDEGEKAGGLLGALSFGLCLGTFLLTRTIQPDTLLVLFLTLAFGSFLSWYRTGRRGAGLTFHLALAGAVLSKGLVGLVLPVGSVVLFLLSEGRLRRLLDLELVSGLPLFVLLTSPWFALCASRNPGFLRRFFLEEHVLRFFGAREPHDYASLSIPLFWLFVLVFLLPWTPLLPRVLGLVRGERGRSLVRLSASWALFGLALFSLSSRLEHYAFAFLPPLCLLLGLSLGRWVEEKDAGSSAGIRLVAWTCLGLGALLAAGFAAILGKGAVRPLSADTTDFGPLFHLPGEIAARLEPLALVSGLVLWIGGALVLVLVRRRLRWQAALSLCALAATLSLLASRALLACEDTLSSRGFGEALAAVAEPGDRVFSMGDFETANSILVYSRQPLLVFDGKASVLEWGLRFPDAPRRVFTQAEFLEAWRGKGRVFLLAPVREVSGLGLPRSRELMRSLDRELLSNEPLTPLGAAW
jgi:4-amino-4-deoxy-L-arabinose transferase-like glycosyltransferase